MIRIPIPVVAFFGSLYGLLKNAVTNIITACISG
jgi:hypothetical protein